MIEVLFARQTDITTLQGYFTNGILNVINGGTGLAGVSGAGQVLYSNGVNSWTTSATPTLTGLVLANGNTSLQFQNNSAVADASIGEGSGGSLLILAGTGNAVFIGDHNNNSYIGMSGANAGGLILSITGAATIATSSAAILSTLDATATNAAAFTIAGGLGVAKQSYFGGTMHLPDGSLWTTSNLNLGNPLQIQSVNVLAKGSLTLYGGTSGSTSIIPQATASGTLTLPAATDQLVARATTDTLTNKTISGSNNTLSNIGNGSLTNSSITLGTTSMSLGSTTSTVAGALSWTGAQTFSGASTAGILVNNAVNTATFISFIISGNTAAAPAHNPANFGNEQWLGQIVNADGNSGGIGIDSFGSNGVYDFRTSGGTNASPTALGAGAIIGVIGGLGYDGFKYTGGHGQIRFVAPTAWTDNGSGTTTNAPEVIQIWTTPPSIAGGAQQTAEFGQTTTSLSYLTLGFAGTSVGQLSLANLTSGTVSLQPPTGALGSAVLTLPDVTDTLTANAATQTLTNKTIDTASNTFKINGTTVATAADFEGTLAVGVIEVHVTGINANSVGDNAFAITFPTGKTHFQVWQTLIRNTGTTASLTTAQYGIFSATGGGGVAIVPSGTALTSLTSNSANTVGNFTQGAAPNGTVVFDNTITNIYFRITQAQGAAATLDVTLLLRFMP